MSFIENNIKWIMLIAGGMTCTMVVSLGHQYLENTMLTIAFGIRISMIQQ